MGQQGTRPNLGYEPRPSGSNFGTPNNNPYLRVQAMEQQKETDDLKAQVYQLKGQIEYQKALSNAPPCGSPSDLKMKAFVSTFDEE